MKGALVRLTRNFKKSLRDGVLVAGMLFGVWFIDNQVTELPVTDFAAKTGIEAGLVYTVQAWAGRALRERLADKGIRIDPTEPKPTQ
jgi:hypothetical protein